MQTGESLCEITIYPAGNQSSGFVCQSCRLIRKVPGTRRIYSGLWQDQPVIVKVFCRRFSAQRHTMREWQALQKMASLQIACPQPLFCGRTEEGFGVIVTAFIPDAQDIFDLYVHHADTEKKIQLLTMVVSQLAHLHIQGIVQEDLHLGNFLLAANRIYLLDPAQIRFYKEPVKLSVSFKQLAQICTNWQADQESELEAFIRKYFATRGLVFRPWYLDKILKMIRACREKAVRRRLRKSLRESKRYLALKRRTWRAVFSKKIWTPKQAADLPTHIDLLMSQGKVLKRGNTCFVCQAQINDRQVVIKRYNHKGFWHSLRQTLQGSRARKCWFHGHRFDDLCIATPKPLAFIEKTRGGIVYCSYIINEFVEGVKFDKYLRDLSRIESEQAEMFERVEAVLRHMEQYRITHGDLKPSNILITSKGPTLIDLDSVRVHKIGFIFRRARDKDIKRLSSITRLSGRRP
jgi:tRNA A-37 threonylcarbamoyl transferase component Bud32